MNNKVPLAATQVTILNIFKQHLFSGTRVFSCNFTHCSFRNACVINGWYLSCDLPFKFLF